MQLTECFYNRNQKVINFSKAGTETNLTLPITLVLLKHLLSALQGHRMRQDSRAVPKETRSLFEETQQATFPKLSFKRGATNILFPFHGMFICYSLSTFYAAKPMQSHISAQEEQYTCLVCMFWLVTRIHCAWSNSPKSADRWSVPLHYHRNSTDKHKTQKIINISSIRKCVPYNQFPVSNAKDQKSCK